MKPLSGKKIALLRPAGAGGELERALAELGASILSVPLIAIAPPEDRSPFLAAAREAASFDWIAFTSQNAVSAFLSAVRESGKEPGEALARVSLASVGPGTTVALRSSGLAPALEAEESMQEGLARSLAARGVAGKRVLLPKADIARDALGRLLREAGAVVTEVVAYRTVEGEGDASLLRRELESGKVDAIAFTSPSTLRSLARKLGEGELRRVFSSGRPLAASMGPVTSKALRELGIEPGAEASPHSAAGLATALVAKLA